jgi:hypothetical protein
MADVQDYDNGDQMQQDDFQAQGDQGGDGYHNGNGDSQARDDDR